MPRKSGTGRGRVPETSLIAVIYAHYSSHNQREESIEQQVSECVTFE